MFDKYQFLEDLKEVLLDEVKNGNLTDIDDAYDIIYQEIDRECIYYSDCFEICKTLGFVNWEDAELPVNNICQAAYSALSELVNEEFNLNEIEEAIEEQEKQEN